MQANILNMVIALITAASLCGGTAPDMLASMAQNSSMEVTVPYGDGQLEVVKYGDNVGAWYFCDVEGCPGHEAPLDLNALPQCETSFDIDLSFAGDCMLATYKGGRYAGSFNDYAATRDPAYFLSGVQSVFAHDDFTVVNLENVLTDKNLTEREKPEDPAYWFRGPTANKNILAAGSVEAVSIANNHTNDYGPDGLSDTVAALESINVPYGTNSQTIYLEKNGYKIAVICHGLWNEGQAPAICDRIRAESKKSDFQIVFFHGGTEHVHEPDAWKVRACHALVDAGADLVIGNHPHVLQPEEVYKGVHIVYSLGNFCYGGSNHPENRTIIYTVRLSVDSRTGALTGVQTKIIPCYVYTGRTNNWQPAIIEDGPAKDKVLAFMAGKTSLPY